jgi:hypothetical protein
MWHLNTEIEQACSCIRVVIRCTTHPVPATHAYRLDSKLAARLRMHAQEASVFLILGGHGVIKLREDLKGWVVGFHNEQSPRGGAGQHRQAQ